MFEFALFLIQYLDHADQVALHGLHRRAQNRARLKAGLLVDRTIKAFVGVGVLNDQTFAGLEHRTGNTGIIQDTNFALEIPLRETGIQLVGDRVVEKQRAAFRRQFPRRHLDDGFKHFVETFNRRHTPGHVEQHLRLLQLTVGLTQFFHAAGTPGLTVRDAVRVIKIIVTIGAVVRGCFRFPNLRRFLSAYRRIARSSRRFFCGGADYVFRRFAHCGRLSRVTRRRSAACAP